MLILLGALGACTTPLDEMNPFKPGPPLEVPPDGWGPGDTATEGVDGAPGEDFPFAEGKILDFELVIPAESVEQLRREGPYVPATFKYAGYEAEVGVRYKGSSTFDTLDGKPSWKLDFGEYTPGARFLDVERLTLNAMRFDPTMLREAVAYKLFSDVGHPAPEHGFARVTVNGTFYGLYSAIETLDENFLERAFPGDPDGNLYDSTFVSADLTGTGKSHFVHQEGDEATAYGDLDSLVGALDAGNILDVLSTRFDKEAVLKYLAVDLLTANWDGYSRNTNNFLLYHGTATDKWYFVPWGQDTAFRGGGPLYAGVRGRVATACQNDGACRAELEQACRDVLSEWETGALLAHTQSLIEMVGPACQEDPRKNEDCDHEHIVEQLTDRPESMRQELGP